MKLEIERFYRSKASIILTINVFLYFRNWLRYSYMRKSVITLETLCISRTCITYVSDKICGVTF